MFKYNHIYLYNQITVKKGSYVKSKNESDYDNPDELGAPGTTVIFGKLLLLLRFIHFFSNITK